MAEAIAFDIATELITKLSSRALAQVGLCWNLKHDIDDLKRTVRTIKAVLLDAEEKSVTDNLVKVWLEELKDVLYDADDLLDDFSTEAFRKDLMGGNKLTKEKTLSNLQLAKHQVKISKWTNCKNNLCHGLKSLFPVFQHLTFLEEFSVSNCEELELSAAGFQIFQDHTSLRDLTLENIPKCRHLPEWLQHLTNLQRLRLVNLPNLTSLPDEMRCLTNLQLLQIARIPQLKERCRTDIGADWHKIAHIPNIRLYQ